MSLLGGAGGGAAFMFLFDPGRGRRRRALLVDRTKHGLRQLRTDLLKDLADAGNRAHGWRYALRRFFSRGRPATDDDILAERVRSRLGRLCSHPGAIDVTCIDGEVQLSGVVLTAEQQRLLEGVARVPGARSVKDRLAAYDRSEHISSLQGEGRPRSGARSWRPRTRLYVDLLGLGMLGWGLKRGGMLGAVLSSAGGLLFLRSVGNRPMTQLLGIDHDPHLIEIRKSIRVDAPEDEVYALFSAPEEFPRFMSHVRSVEQVRDGIYRWSVDGPAGTSVSWEAEVTEDVPNELIAWRSTPDAAVAQAGTVHFVPDARGGTRIDIQMFYNPPAGAIGHLFARLLGSDPRHEMDDDLLRLKSLLEKGKATAHGRTVWREEILPVI